ncbi:MAG: hypothetical protein HFF05_03325 [Oscillospiraceae bacterium]|nr:hypothetical protein [Oscillospiraceae bacterium]
MDEQEKEQQPIKYATPMQRLWAWVGVVYMVILVLLTTYALAFGAYLRGIGGLMLAPALCGLGSSAILRYRQGMGRGGLPACVVVSAAAFLLAVWNLIRSIPALLGQFVR